VIGYPQFSVIDFPQLIVIGYPQFSVIDYEIV
jgi:hypothetical protein